VLSEEKKRAKAKGKKLNKVAKEMMAAQIIINTLELRTKREFVNKMMTTTTTTTTINTRNQ
jgi:ethanolamine utilization protein EutA (predicted chaperonin)